MNKIEELLLSSINNYYNYIFVRKYASADPTPSIQSEETGTGRGHGAESGR